MAAHVPRNEVLYTFLILFIVYIHHASTVGVLVSAAVSFNRRRPCVCWNFPQVDDLVPPMLYIFLLADTGPGQRMLTFWEFMQVNIAITFCFENAVGATNYSGDIHRCIGW